MKTSMYVSVALSATLFFASCSKETTEPAPQPGERNARVELTITGTQTTNSRATGNLPTDEATIKTLVVGVFIGENVNKIQEITDPTVTSGKATATLNECSSGVCDIIVVANAPAETFKDVTTKTAFLAKTVKLKETAGVRGKDNLPMSGQTASSVTLQAGTTTTVPDAISLVRLVARVAITSITTDFNTGAYAEASFTAEKVFMYNAASTSTVAPGTAATTSDLISGETVAANNYLLETITTGTIAAPYWFYTFANGATTPTRLVIAGKFKAAGDSGQGETVYYPIVINKTGLGTAAQVVRNTLYNLTATIKGKGVDSPDKEIAPATLTLDVTVAPWASTITQDVTFE